MPGCKNSWDPHLYYNTKFTEGVLVESFWLRVEKGTAMYHEWRDALTPYHTGPQFEVTAQGRLRAAGKNLLEVEPGTWLHIQITCGLGSSSTGTYSMVVTPSGKEPLRFDKLRLVSKSFKELNWLGWVSSGTKEATFYLDDIKVGPLLP